MAQDEPFHGRVEQDLAGLNGNRILLHLILTTVRIRPQFVVFGHGKGRTLKNTL